MNDLMNIEAEAARPVITARTALDIATELVDALAIGGDDIDRKRHIGKLVAELVEATKDPTK